MTKDKEIQEKPERRPDVVRIRKVYDLMICAILALMFIVGPIYLMIALYRPKWLF